MIQYIAPTTIKGFIGSVVLPIPVKEFVNGLRDVERKLHWNAAHPIGKWYKDTKN